MTTKKAVIALAKDGETQAPVWRVINQNGSLISQYPGGIDVQAARLMEEGAALETDGKSLKVKGFKERLFHFED